MRHSLRHRSYVAETEGVTSNERLEFLGDSVLGLVVTDEIYSAYPDLPEGQLAKLRASVVNTDSLAEIGETLGLGEHILLGKGEASSGGGAKPSILADTVEAVIGAIYLDAGLEAARPIVLSWTQPKIESGAVAPGATDYKTLLQELCASLDKGTPEYKIVGSGPDHDRSFSATIVVEGVELGAGSGSSKKRAEQKAASIAIEALKTANN